MTLAGRKPAQDSGDWYRLRHRSRAHTRVFCVALERVVNSLEQVILASLLIRFSFGNVQPDAC